MYIICTVLLHTTCIALNKISYSLIYIFKNSLTVSILTTNIEMVNKGYILQCGSNPEGV